MTSTDQEALRGFAVKLPPGFIGLPTQEPTQTELDRIADGLEEMFHLFDGDESAAEMARWFSTAGHIAGAGGMEFAAIGFFHSPADQDRPVSVMVTGGRLPGNFHSPEEAIAGLQELYGAENDSSTRCIRLTAGPAVLVTSEQPVAVQGNEENENCIIQREVRAWMPDTTGSTVGVVSVSTASWRDWAYVCDLALQIFDSALWEPTDSPSTTRVNY